MGECEVTGCHRPAYTVDDGMWLCAIHYEEERTLPTTDATEVSP